MALTSNSPRKVVPLRDGEDTRPQTPAGTSTTSRAFFCGVVVESGYDKELSSDMQALVASLGEHMSSVDGTSAPVALHDTTPPELTGLPSPTTRKRALTNSSALADVLNEFVSTERSYVKRLRILKESYADPLRTFARTKDTALLPAYEAKTLFGNIDNILAVNEAFLHDLEQMGTSKVHNVGGIGDVALKHFKQLKAFDCYKQYYAKREEAQAILKRERLKKSSTGFAAFVERIKDSTADARNRVGLSELLMDPVQRIPRYTLLWELMIKYMPSSDPQRAKLVEASRIAQKIAKCEIDDSTRRAAVMHCLERSVEDFPPELISNGRRFIDCIDVEDIPVDGSSGSMYTSTSTASSAGILHCTLFLFDDKLMIVKRPHASASGRALTGLDQLDKAAKTGGIPLAVKRKEMSFKGLLEVTEVVATDVGASDFHLFLEVPPHDQTERWSGRPFRALSIVHPPSPINLDPVRSQTDKHRFLENLWTAQAAYRARHGRSVVLCSSEKEVEARAGRVTLARTYFNVYQRTAYLGEPKKPKIVLHIDPSGAADPLPFGINEPPYVIVRVQPMAGDLSRYAVASSDPNDDGEVDIVHTPTVPSRIVQTIHQFGLFKFRTGQNSAPSTPSASTRSRTAMFGLDAISRNLFPGVMGRGGDVFGAVLNNHNPKRSRSAASRTSTQTIATMDSAIKFSTRSTSTAATSVFTDMESSHGSPLRKLQKERKSPSSSRSSPTRSRSGSRSRSRDRGDGHPGDPMDESDWDLHTRLELARRNSRNQHGNELPVYPANPPVEDTIYEEDPPAPAAKISRMSAQPTTPIRRGSTTPTNERSELPRRSRPHSTPVSTPTDRRPMGPRPPSPLPPRSPECRPDHIDRALENTLDHMSHAPHVTPVRQTSKTSTSPSLSRSRRLPLEPRANDATPRGNIESVPSTNSVEPLSIKKKVSVRSGTGVSPPSRNRHSQAPTRAASTRRTSPQVRGAVKRTRSINQHGKPDLSDRLLVTAQSTREDVDSVRRVVKRIKLEFTALKTSLTNDDNAQDTESGFTPSRGVLPRSPHTRHMSAKSEADARKEEMRQMIAMRQVDSPFRQIHGNTPQRPTSPVKDTFRLQEWTATVDTLVGQSERELKRAAANQELLHADLKELITELKEASSELVAAHAEQQSSKRQCELVKNLLADSTAENDILHKAFNEELDGMFRDANLPETEAWAAMTQDLMESKAARNNLKRENVSLKRKLEETELQKEEWGKLLQAHGLIP